MGERLLLGFGADSIKNCGCHGNRKLPLTYNGENDVSMFTSSVLIRSSSNLQVTRTGIKSQTSLNQIRHFVVTCPQIPAGSDQSLWSCVPLSAKKFLIYSNFQTWISLKTSWPVLVKFYVQHQWGGGKAELGLWVDWIKTVVVMATKSSYWLIMGKLVSPFLSHFWSHLRQTCRCPRQA